MSEESTRIKRQWAYAPETVQYLSKTAGDMGIAPGTMVDLLVQRVQDLTPDMQVQVHRLAVACEQMQTRLGEVLEMCQCLEVQAQRFDERVEAVETLLGNFVKLLGLMKDAPKPSEEQPPAEPTPAPALDLTGNGYYNFSTPVQAEPAQESSTIPAPLTPWQWLKARW